MVHVNNDHDLAEAVTKNCELEEGGKTGSQGSGQSHPAREKASKEGSIS